MTSLETWSLGYCRARGYVDPAPGPAGLWLRIDLPEQVGRHVFTGPFAPDAYRRLVASVTEPFVYVEALAPRDAVLPLVPDSWTPRDTHWLMSRTLTAEAAPTPPDGYGLRLVETAKMSRIEIDGPAGDLAASGNCGLGGAHATFDRIITDEAHRRRGLGSIVMRALTLAVRARGATTGELIATPDGRALYRALGWTEVGAVTSVISGG